MSWLQASCKSWIHEHFQIAKFLGPTRGPPGSCRPQIGPCCPHEPCDQGSFIYNACQDICRQFMLCCSLALHTFQGWFIGMGNNRIALMAVKQSCRYSSFVYASPRQHRESDWIINQLDDGGKKLFWKAIPHLVLQPSNPRSLSRQLIPMRLQHLCTIKHDLVSYFNTAKLLHSMVIFFHS